MRMSVELGRFSLSSLEPSDDVFPPPTPSQKELMHRLHETKRQKDEYYENWKKSESALQKLQDEHSTLLSTLQTSSSNTLSVEKNNSESASVYAFNSLSKELSKLTKIFTKQENVFKKCIQSSESNINTYQKLQEKVVDYITLCKASDLHIQKIMNQNQNDKSSVSDTQKTERIVLESPSLFDELKEFEEDVQTKHENAVLVSEAHIAKIACIKEILELLRDEIKTLGQTDSIKTHFSKDYLINLATRNSIRVLNV